LWLRNPIKNKPAHPCPQNISTYKDRNGKKMKKKLSEEAKLKTKKVRFNLYAPEAEKVFLTGDFNNWDVDNLPMKKDSK
jgi:1,4-alpha-glucan branching enzyme